ncbi:hypothetical protein CRE_13574 [Caenorhabditis remanei]|uniref:Uncharacterized protein n=1 Tax=Caenorhabditis remanei TaxID=31234 RepID=E3N1B1_CAERE|nr:hypothetical protein CRE_13574 [Caenorhabditis remanei]
MSRNSNNDAEEKSEKTISSDRPFLLEIFPEKLEVPPEGLLEVTIKNPTAHEQNLTCRFDSFYFLVDFKNANWSQEQEGDTPSAAIAYHTLKPGETYTLTIGYDNGNYPKWPLPCPTCNNERRIVRKKDDTKKQRLDPKDNIYYNLKRPEGVLKITYDNKKTYNDYISKKMDIYLIEETEKYRMLKEVYLKIRLDQKRRKRWGETLQTRGCITYRSFKLDDGKSEYDLREFFGGYNEESRFKSDYISPEVFWEKVLANRCTPKNLEEFDSLSNEEIMKIKRDRRAQYILGQFILNENDLQKEVEECWGDQCLCEMPRLLTRKEFEKSMEPYAKPEEKSVQKVVEVEKPKTIKEPKDKSKKSLKKLPQSEKSAPSSKFDNVESVHKSSEKLKQEEAKAEEEKKTPTTPQVAPIPKEKKAVVQEKKNKKKKKGNPCCSVS